MPAFKPKATKKITKDTKNILTVDNQHQEKMNVFKHTECMLICDPLCRNEAKVAREDSP